MSQPKTLKIFLLNGEPTGTKIVEISNWTGKAFVIPRKGLKNIINREELNSQAVYFLIGESEEDKTKVYVGEAEEFKKRIQQHNKNKDFWNIAVCFISKDDNLTKAHVKYLEAVIIEEVKKANRVELENGNNGAIPKLPESDEADLNLFLDNLKVILSSLGFVFLEDLSVKNEEDEEIYYVKGKNARGRIKLTNEGYVVQVDSILTGEDAPAFSGSPLSELRKKLFKSDKVNRDENGDYQLLEKMVFSSPSYAAAFILGRNANGWTELKDKNGKTLDELKRS